MPNYAKRKINFVTGNIQFLFEKWNKRLRISVDKEKEKSAKMSSYFSKLMRIPSHHFEPPREKQRSRSLDVEALERSGIKMLRVVRDFTIFLKIPLTSWPPHYELWILNWKLNSTKLYRGGWMALSDWWGVQNLVIAY